MIHKKQNFRLSKEVLNQRIDNESVLLDMKSECYFKLNDVGSHVLEMLRNGTNLKELTNNLLDIYDVKEAQLTTDITQLLQQLLDAELIVPYN